MPRVQNAQADLAVVVQVGVEANRLVASCLQVDEWRRLRVVSGKEDVELEAAVVVGRVLGPCNEDFHHVEAFFVTTGEHGAAVGERQGVADCDRLLGEALGSVRRAEVVGLVE